MSEVWKGIEKISACQGQTLMELWPFEVKITKRFEVQQLQIVG